MSQYVANTRYSHGFTDWRGLYGVKTYDISDPVFARRRPEIDETETDVLELLWVAKFGARGVSVYTLFEQEGDEWMAIAHVLWKRKRLHEAYDHYVGAHMYALLRQPS